MLDGSIRRHWLARSGIFLPSVSQVVLRNLVVSQSICEKVRPLRSAEMGKLGAANFKLRYHPSWDLAGKKSISRSY